MTDVTIPALALAAHGLPQLGLCPRHGQQTTRTSRRSFSTRAPAWSYLLIFVGLLLFLVVVLSVRKQVAGPFPECRECDRDRRRFKLWVAAGWSVSSLVLGLALWKANEPLLGIGSLLLVAALILSGMGDRFRVSGWLSKDEAWLTLKGVHPAFAQASNAAQQAAVAAQQSYAAQPVGAAAPSYPLTRQW